MLLLVGAPDATLSSWIMMRHSTSGSAMPPREQVQRPSSRAFARAFSVSLCAHPTTGNTEDRASLNRCDTLESRRRNHLQHGLRPLSHCCNSRHRRYHTLPDSRKRLQHQGRLSAGRVHGHHSNGAVPRSSPGREEHHGEAPRPGQGPGCSPGEGLL